MRELFRRSFKDSAYVCCLGMLAWLTSTAGGSTQLICSLLDAVVGHNHQVGMGFMKVGWFEGNLGQSSNAEVMEGFHVTIAPTFHDELDVRNCALTFCQPYLKDALHCHAVVYVYIVTSWLQVTHQGFYREGASRCIGLILFREQDGTAARAIRSVLTEQAYFIVCHKIVCVVPDVTKVSSGLALNREFFTLSKWCKVDNMKSSLFKAYPEITVSLPYQKHVGDPWRCVTFLMIEEEERY